jgi:hypothetical protein
MQILGILMCYAGSDHADERKILLLSTYRGSADLARDLQTVTKTIGKRPVIMKSFELLLKRRKESKRTLSSYQSGLMHKHSLCEIIQVSP